MIRSVRILLKKPIFEKGNADWLFELPCVIKKYIYSIHKSAKTTPIQASKKANEKLVYSNLQDRRVSQQSKYELGQLVRTADIKGIFSKADITNWSYKLNTITEVTHDTIPTF